MDYPCVYKLLGVAAARSSLVAALARGCAPFSRTVSAQPSISSISRRGEAASSDERRFIKIDRRYGRAPLGRVVEGIER
eukprot:6196722-Pleurochrysis_carterae.AAC.4